MKKQNLRLILFLVFSLLFTSVYAEVAPVTPDKNAEMTVMTFNAENLFDTKHDKGTEDHTYLPLAKKKKDKNVQKACAAMTNNYYKKQCFELDWNEEILDAKMQQIASLFQSVNGGKGPDNVLLSEVENIRVLKQLNNKYLKDFKYKTVVLLEGFDSRGIDTAFLSKYPQVGKAQVHAIPFTDPDPEKQKKAQDTRGLLEVTVLAPNGKEITFLSAHFPSQSNPTEWRAQAVQFAKGLMQKYQTENRAVILGGDLNIISTEEAQHGYFKNVLSETGEVSHLVGCKTCAGTHNYKGAWSFLDVMVFSKNFKKAGFELITESIEVVKTPINADEKGLPIRFDKETGKGVSDHLPLFVKIRLL